MGIKDAVVCACGHTNVPRDNKGVKLLVLICVCASVVARAHTRNKSRLERGTGSTPVRDRGPAPR